MMNNLARTSQFQDKNWQISTSFIILYDLKYIFVNMLTWG